MSRPQNAIERLSRGESVEVAQKDGESASGEALPEGWAIASFDQVTGVMRNGTSTKQNKDGTGVAVSRIETIATGEIDFEKVGHIADAADDLVEKYRLVEGDILFSHINSASHLGKTAIYKDESRRLLHGMNLMLFRMEKDAIEPLLFHYFCTLHRARGDFSLIAQHAVNQASLNQKKLKAVELPLPPKAEQSRIVSAIESLQERSSRARVLLSEVGPLIGQLRQSVLRDAFSGKLTRDWRRQNPAPSGDPERRSAGSETASELLLRIRTERRERWQSEQLAKYEAKGKQPLKNWEDKYKEPEPVDESELPELPDGWCWVSVGTVLDVVSGYAFKSKDFIEEGTPVVKIANVSYGKFVWKQQEYLDESYFKAHPNFVVRSGDTLLALTRPITENRLKACVYPDDAPPALLNQRVAMLRSFSPEVDSYLNSLLHTDYFKELVSSLLSETLQPNLSPVDLESAPIPLAPLGEQAEIVSVVEQATKSVGGLSEVVASMESSLTQLDQSILSKAFRGELVPQDSGDEPASELLARIRTTRESTATSAKKKTTKKGTRKRKARSNA